MTERRDFSFSEGETWVIDATLTDNEGAVLNLTGATVEWLVAKRPGVAAVVTANTGNSLVDIDPVPATGKINVAVPYGSHVNALPGHWLHECRVTLASGEVSVQFNGRLVVRDSLFVI